MSNVLLIEPNAVLARTYMQALQHAGYSVVHATGAQDAIDAADTCHPDIVVMELQLAAHNGVEFLHEFRSYSEWQHVPAIVHTAISPVALEPLLEALRQDLGVIDCLYKPRTTLAQLASTVRKQLALV